MAAFGPGLAAAAGAYGFVRSALRLARRAATNSGKRGDVYGFRVMRTLRP